MSRGLSALAIGIAGLVVYLWLAVTLADHVIGRHWAVALAYYLLAGLAWAWPAARLMRWALSPR